MFLIYHMMLLLNVLFSYGETIIVETKQGKLRGEKLQVVTGDCSYFSFKGIPYAKPPLGDLRFLAPQSPESWNGIRNATQHGSICIQGDFFDKNSISGSEDCLFLNVYTPNVKPSELLPVMVFIHGGSLQRGSGNDDRYGPVYLMPENILLVTINYRLGALGFLSLNSVEIPGNAGLKDQVAAMKWVKENIAKFGGDPNKVTIIGQSAGAACVGLHNLSNLTRGLYKRSVMMSGSPLNDWAWPFEPRRFALRLKQQLGLKSSNDQELAKLFKALPAEQFLGYNPAVLRSESPNNPLKQLNYTPIIEIHNGKDNFLTVDPMEALKEGKMHDVDLMIGHTAMDGLIYFVVIGDSIIDLYTNYSEMVVPRKILENISPAKMLGLADKIHSQYFGDKPINDCVPNEFVKFMSDSSFNYGISKYGEMFSEHRNTYMYKFSKLTNFTRFINLDNKFGINAATDFDDLLYLLYPHNGNVTIDKSSADYRVVKTTCALYANFARNGNPTPDTSLNVSWPTYNGKSRGYLDIDTKLTVGEHLDARAVSFWNSIHKEAETYMLHK